jgi:hypothetical protein
MPNASSAVPGAFYIGPRPPARKLRRTPNFITVIWPTPAGDDMSPNRIGIFAAAMGMLLLGQVAQAETSTDFTYSTAQHGYLTLTAAAFHPGRNDYTNANDGHGLHITNPGTMCFVAPLQLPHRARVRNDVLIGYGMEEAGSFTFGIYSQKLIDGHTTQLLYSAPPVTDAGS